MVSSVPSQCISKEKNISYLHFQNVADGVKDEIPFIVPFRQQTADRHLKYSDSGELSAQAELHITPCLVAVEIVQTECRRVG
jgi:hypothetical protein